ncbi:hypothetical protein [Bradyrhizobium cenepequi]
MKYAKDRPYADPEKAARRIMELARAVESIQDGRRQKLAIKRGWLWMRESGTYVKITLEGAELFA